MWSAWTACCVWQAAVVQQSCGMRTRNGGGRYQQYAEESQKKKGNKHITMQYLEQGGYFDVPIHVSQTGLLSRACLHSSSSLLPKLECCCMQSSRAGIFPLMCLTGSVSTVQMEDTSPMH